jgi:hypothetical protein
MAVFFALEARFRKEKATEQVSRAAIFHSVVIYIWGIFV